MGHHLLVARVAAIGFVWEPQLPGWMRPGLPGLSNLAGPMQHFRSAILDARCGKGGSLLDIAGSQQLHSLSHVRERDKSLPRSIFVGGV